MEQMLKHMRIDQDMHGIGVDDVEMYYTMKEIVLKHNVIVMKQVVEVHVHEEEEAKVVEIFVIHHVEVLQRDDKVLP